MKVAVIDNGVDSERVDCLQEVDLSEKYSIEKDEKNMDTVRFVRQLLRSMRLRLRL